MAFPGFLVSNRPRFRPAPSLLYRSKFWILSFLAFFYSLSPIDAIPPTSSQTLKQRKSMLPSSGESKIKCPLYDSNMFMCPANYNTGPFLIYSVVNYFLKVLFMNI